MSARLQDAIEQRVREYEDTYDRLRGINDVKDKDIEALREAMELLRCLRRLLGGRTVREVHDAFGAPGDFGYESLIGQALAETYRGTP